MCEHRNYEWMCTYLGKYIRYVQYGAIISVYLVNDYMASGIFSLVSKVLFAFIARVPPRACSLWIDRKTWISLVVNYKCAKCANLMAIKSYTCVFSISSMLDVFAKIALFSTLMFRLRWHRHSWRMQLKYDPSLGDGSVPGQKNFFADHSLGFKKTLRRSYGRYHEVLSGTLSDQETNES